jgi:hypothetical protein
VDNSSEATPEASVAPPACFKEDAKDDAEIGCEGTVAATARDEIKLSFVIALVTGRTGCDALVPVI